MGRIKRAAFVVVAVVATVLVTTEVQARAVREPVLQQAPPTAADIGAGVTETKFVPIAPCRIYDTRQGQGGQRIGAGNFRILKARGPETIAGQYAGQGGKPGGCGIPASATAIEGTVSAVSAAGTGFLRAWPSGQPETTSTFLNYIQGFNASNTGALDICDVSCGVASDLRVKAFGAATHVVIDVQGYYVKPMAAVLNASGGLVRGSRVVATSRPSVGQYLVQFDRTVDQCVAVASVDGTTGSGYAMVGPDSADNTRVYVFAADANGTLVNRSVHLTLTC